MDERIFWRFVAVTLEELNTIALSDEVERWESLLCNIEDDKEDQSNSSE